MKLPRFFGRLKRLRFYIRRVTGDSMLPALAPGTIIVAIPRPLKVGQVIILQHQQRQKIKRLAKLNAEQVYVLGDNLAHSTDSRSFGYLPLSCVQGVVIWPHGLVSASRRKR
jgi:nickel-type superoxide dismutase maturation protease